ncbi:hypothetical protein Cni_G26642 [Canna indica]|uniref:Uncharacterized protein n=1 Tax=Canna indica TaxID=4628 RepID=A0AAQ3QNK2_9LILI|nr:hypothetical protein Cni_G26642 [Canna indica]
MLLWEQMRVLNTQNAPWLVLGDFNCVDKPEDKRGGKPFYIGSSLNVFKLLCLETGLIDLSYKGPHFTWCNNRGNNKRIMARLDKAYSNSEWLSSFHNTEVLHLEKVASDHRQILVDTNSQKFMTSKKGAFNFELYWIDYPEVKELVSNVWNDEMWSSNYMNCFSSCLNKLEKVMIAWKKSQVGSLENSLKLAMDELRILEDIDSKGLCDENDLLRLRCLNNKIMALNR